MYKYLLLICLLLPLASCTSERLSDRPQLTTSIEPLRYLVEQIAGEHYDVTSLAPAGVSPETYEPTPQQLVGLANAKAYFAIGTLGFEQTQLKKIVEDTPSLDIFNLTDSLTILPSAHNHGDASGDLHVWMSTKNMKTMGERVCRILSEIDSVNAPYFARRLAAFSAHCDSLDALIRQTLKPVVRRSFVIYHPALAYFAKDYGLTQYAIEHDGKEPTPETLRQLIRTCRAQDIRTIFVQKEYAGKAAQKLADELGTRIIPINPLSHEWDKEMLHTARSIR